MKKIILFGCILLLILTSFTQISSSYKISANNIIYVDDDASPPYDGTQEHPYQFIQDGVNTASEGDTVFVYSGIYYDRGQPYEVNRISCPCSTRFFSFL